MIQKIRFRQFIRFIFKWLLLTIPVALAVGSLVALFLWLLDQATHTRMQYPALVCCLPLAGIVIHWLYRFYGGRSEAGNNLVIEEIHKPGPGVPARMTPLVLVTTVITHLFGGSAGREGTAVQMGGSTAAFIGRKLGLDTSDTRMMLQCGIAAGFGAVFGTPVAGTIFALEVLVMGKMRWDALLPCFMAAVFADRVTAYWGIQHTHYNIVSLVGDGWPALHVGLMVPALLVGLLSGLTAYAFSFAVHRIKEYSHRLIPVLWLIPITGGLLIAGLSFVPGFIDYLGLGVYPVRPGGASITTAFTTLSIDPFAWLWKLLFTAITLGTGFKGGEVTPLFFMGAALGHSLAVVCGVPVDFMAGLGFIAVFAGAANTPVSCVLMGIELFGAEYTLHFALACFVAYYFSGHKGIYSAQRRNTTKWLR